MSAPAPRVLIEPTVDAGCFCILVENAESGVAEGLMGDLSLAYPAWDKAQNAIFNLSGESRARSAARALCGRPDSWHISLPPSICPHSRMVRVDMRTYRVVCETCGGTGKLTPVIRTNWDGSTFTAVDWRWQGQPPMKLRVDE